MEARLWDYEAVSRPKRQGSLTMRNATNAMNAVGRGASAARLGALCVALTVAIAGASVGVADDIEEEPSNAEISDDSVVVIILDGGIRYEGTVRNGKIHGEGKLTFPDGRVYEGEFANGQIEGEGTYTYPDDRSYVGKFHNGRRNGHGIVSFPSGEIYEGQWLDDKKNGQGTVLWPDGAEYTGGFRDGKMHGQGIYTYPNGRLREGSWKKGEFVREQPVPAQR